MYNELYVTRDGLVWSPKSDKKHDIVLLRGDFIGRSEGDVLRILAQHTMALIDEVVQRQTDHARQFVANLFATATEEPQVLHSNVGRAIGARSSAYSSSYAEYSMQVVGNEFIYRYSYESGSVFERDRSEEYRFPLNDLERATILWISAAHSSNRLPNPMEERPLSAEIRALLSFWGFWQHERRRFDERDLVRVHYVMGGFDRYSRLGAFLG